MAQKGTLYGIGVGPGDPELMTVKAIRTILACDVIAAPLTNAEKQSALDIARRHVGEKPVLPLDLPMTREEAVLRKNRVAAAGRIIEQLDEGKDVGFLCLGDPMIYSTYGYIQAIVAGRGYAVAAVSGVTSFCAAAAALGEPLCEGGEALHIIPAAYGDLDAALALDGVKVLMKPGKQWRGAREAIKRKAGASKVFLAMRVGMEGERLVRDLPLVADGECLDWNLPSAPGGGGHGVTEVGGPKTEGGGSADGLNAGVAKLSAEAEASGLERAAAEASEPETEAVTDDAAESETAATEAAWDDYFSLIVVK